jgi:predicted transcriptional regulator
LTASPTVHPLFLSRAVREAMRTLRHEKWIDERDVKSGEGKGRPHKVYALITPVDEIIKIIEEERQKEIGEAMESIQKLKELASS